MEELPYLLFCISFNFASWSILIILMTYQPIIMETSAVMTDKSALISDVKERWQDIYLAISWRELKRDYFDNGKSMSWFQHKIYGIDGNGGVGGFTPQEIEQLRGALCDLSDRIRRAADKLSPASILPY